eukprot:GHVU01217797.1.p1 GENE.GHVU01217797.1~~GHVU01217797.1.p1  ORF type:complete len:113 (+),score=7.50 GHVU01217797.1:323-661(+)
MYPLPLTISTLALCGSVSFCLQLTAVCQAVLQASTCSNSLVRESAAKLMHEIAKLDDDELVYRMGALPLLNDAVVKMRHREEKGHDPHFNDWKASDGSKGPAEMIESVRLLP